MYGKLSPNAPKNPFDINQSPAHIGLQQSSATSGKMQCPGNIGLIRLKPQGKNDARFPTTGLAI